MKEFLENQYKNAFLWSPFVMAFGAALYFSLNNEPNFQFPILIAVLLGPIIYRHRNIILTAVALFFFGFFYSMSYTHIIDTPQIYQSFGKTFVSGTVTNIDYTDKSTRILLNVPTTQINSNLSSDKYTNIQLTIAPALPIPNINDTLSGNARIFHPSAQNIPNSFDYARWAYFHKLSGTGFITDYSIVPINTNNSVRDKIHKVANSKLTDGLVLGYKHIIPKHESDIWQSVGVGHVWSISGFHMALVGGWLFALFYLLFRCIPKITKRMPAKYPAMFCAWTGLAFYLCISGFSVATVRAFLMTTLIFCACIFNRNALSLRNAALVFMIIFLINPFYVMQVGFQLSFAAIFGLLWFYHDRKYAKRNLIGRIGHWLYTALMTAVIAGIFTLPFIIANFGYIPLYTIIGNIIILPIFSFAIMPFVMIGTICSLFGGHLILETANNIYEFAFRIATKIANLPYANININYMPNSVLVLCVIGLLCIILIVRLNSKNLIKHNINYVLGCAFIITAIYIQNTQTTPLFYSTVDNELVGFVENDKLQFNKAKSSKHYRVFNAWRDFNNEPASDKNTRKKCEHGLCIYKTPKWNLVYMQTIKTVIDNIETICRDKNIDFIVTPIQIKAPNCHAKILHGGMIIYPNGKVKSIAGNRPWHKGL